MWRDWIVTFKKNRETFRETKVSRENARPATPWPSNRARLVPRARLPPGAPLPWSGTFNGCRVAIGIARFVCNYYVCSGCYYNLNHYYYNDCKAWWVVFKTHVPFVFENTPSCFHTNNVLFHIWCVNNNVTETVNPTGFVGPHYCFLFFCIYLLTHFK